MRLVPAAIAVTVASLLLIGCRPSPSAPTDGLSGTVELSGSSTIAPLATEIGKRFESTHPGVRINVQTGGSSRGIADAGRGIVDIGMSSRGLKDSEREGRKEWRIAMDGVCFLVHASNPATDLTREQLVEIYTGKIDNWSAFGGSDRPITVINRAAGRSELELVTKFFGLKAEEIKADLIAGENQQGIKMVANDPLAIVYMSVGASEFAVNEGTKIKLLPLDGVAASVANVAAGKFPLSRPLIFVTSPDPSELAMEFIRYAQSREVHDLVRELAYVPIEGG